MRGRWPAGLEYIDKLEGSVETKERFKSILHTVSRGTRFGGIRPTRHWRNVSSNCAGRPSGRPNDRATSGRAEPSVRRSTNREIRAAATRPRGASLHEAQVRAEIALVLQPARRDVQDDRTTATGVEKKMPRPRVKIQKSR